MKIIKLDLNYLRNENIDYTTMIVFLDTKGKTLKLENMVKYLLKSRLSRLCRNKEKQGGSFVSFNSCQN